MGEMLSVYLFSSNENSQALNIKTINESQLFKLVGSSSDLNETINKVLFMKPNILFIDILDNSFLDNAFKLISDLKSKNYNIYTILLIKQGMTFSLRKLIQEGANDFLYSPLSQQVLISAYDAYINFYSKSEELIIKKRDLKTTRLISFFSPKGGVGKTFLALNTAAGIANLSNNRVLYVDLSFPYSNSPIMLNINPGLKNVYDLMFYMEINPTKYPKEFILSLDKINLFMILPPRSLSEVSHINSHTFELKQTVENLRTYFDFTIIDMPPRYYDFCIDIFRITDENYGVVTPEGENTVLLHRFIEDMMSLGVPISHKIVLNRKNEKVSRVLGKEWKALIPDGLFTEITDDPLEAGIANNLGELLILRNTNSQVKEDLITLVNKICKA